MGGGPSDLTFPVSPFLGRWDVTSTLIKVDLPLGPDFVPDMQVRWLLLALLLLPPTFKLELRSFRSCWCCWRPFVSLRAWHVP